MWNTRRDQQRRNIVKGAMAQQIGAGKSFLLGHVTCGRIVIPTDGHGSTCKKRACRGQTRTAQPQNSHLLS
jgi:hypothetical protein